MPSRGFPIIDPRLADSIGPLDQLFAGRMAVFDDHDKSGIEILLCVIDIGRARTLGVNHILNRDLGSLCLEDLMAVRVFLDGSEISQNEKVRHFRC